VYIEDAGSAVILMHFLEIVDDEVVDIADQNHVLVVIAEIVVLDALELLVALLDDPESLGEAPLLIGNME
jgi:hypothetical protein